MTSTLPSQAPVLGDARGSFQRHASSGLEGLESQVRSVGARARRAIIQAQMKEAMEKAIAQPTMPLPTRRQFTATQSLPILPFRRLDHAPPLLFDATRETYEQVFQRESEIRPVNWDTAPITSLRAQEPVVEEGGDGFDMDEVFAEGSEGGFGGGEVGDDAAADTVPRFGSRITVDSLGRTVDNIRDINLGSTGGEGEETDGMGAMRESAKPVVGGRRGMSKAHSMPATTGFLQRED
ncbi:hypothetical protein P7C70_g7015, partial [Phenoliferia sp. Uapishka_3]